ncbi:MAG: PfkB domain protein [Acidimicrobiales bacterium]|nr:PfkB domain protein [Acidimicrobiales bacterium]
MSTYVAVGSVCWDVVEGSDDARLGGSVLFSSRVALARGWDARIVTSGTAQLEAALVAALPDVEVHVERSATDTIFGFSVHAELGPQRLVSRADQIDLSRHAFGDADVLHLAPIMDEIAHGSFGATARAGFVGITPQGFLRAADPTTGALLRHERLDAWWVEHVGAVVLSEDEYARLAQPDALRSIPTAVTRGERGCVGRLGDEVLEVPGVDVGDVSPVGTIGAGDVFGAAFFVALAEGLDFAAALMAANETAAGHVGRGDFASRPEASGPKPDPEMRRPN